MCGIAGLLSSDPTCFGDVHAMTDALRHRGPDDGDAWIDPAAGVAFGHRRLAVIDLSQAGHQPMHSACGRYVIVFNGEIYNNLELRAALEARGGVCAWRGHSDTETLLTCVVTWGVRATLERLVGMFAFGLFDRKERRLHLARDRFGEKPLYYGWTKKAFVFGSELSALRRAPGFDNPIDRDVVALYLQFCYVPAPYAIYQNIYKLEPGCVLSMTLADASVPFSTAPFAPCTRSGGFQIERYWSLPDIARRGLADPIMSEGEAVEQLESALANAVRRQCISDVPLGAFLSGGIDSSTIVALMQAQATQPVRTFTIGFHDAAFNEAEHAKAVAKHLGTDHTEMYVTPREAQEVIPQLPQLYSEPFADASQIPTHLVAQIARQHVTVALSGDAGDELFAGYNRYFWGRRIWSRLSWMPLVARRRLGAAIQKIPVGAWDAIGVKMPGPSRVARLGEKAHKLAHRLRTVQDLDGLYRSLVMQWPFGDAVVLGARTLPTLLDSPALVRDVPEAENRMMLWDALTYLPDDILQKVDRAAMGVSLETRVPFLDPRVAELAWRIPLHMKIRHGKGKWVLRQVLYKHVPRELIERPKAGFGVPIHQWLRGPLRDWAENLLDEVRLRQDGFFDVELVRDSWARHVNGTHDETAKLWAVLMFQAWLQGERG